MPNILALVALISLYATNKTEIEVVAVLFLATHLAQQASTDIPYLLLAPLL